MTAPALELTCSHPLIPGTLACPVCDPPPDWQLAAACLTAGLDPDAWFPGHAAGDVALGPRAERVCCGCPVRPYCLELGWAERTGTWGGWPEPARSHAWNTHGRTPARAVVRALAVHPPITRGGA